MDTKTGNMALVYGAVAVMSVLLLVCYLLWEKKRERRFAPGVCLCGNDKCRAVS